MQEEEESRVQTDLEYEMAKEKKFLVGLNDQTSDIPRLRQMINSNSSNVDRDYERMVEIYDKYQQNLDSGIVYNVNAKLNAEDQITNSIKPIIKNFKAAGYQPAINSYSVLAGGKKKKTRRRSNKKKGKRSSKKRRSSKKKGRK